MAIDQPPMALPGSRSGRQMKWLRRPAGQVDGLRTGYPVHAPLCPRGRPKSDFRFLKGWVIIILDRYSFVAKEAPIMRRAIAKFRSVQARIEATARRLRADERGVSFIVTALAATVLLGFS